MKITTGIFALIFTFTSCNIPKDGERENIPTSKLEALTMLEDVEDSAKKEKATATDIKKPILIARGSEPGWYAEFFEDHLFLVADHGKDTLQIKNDFSGINSSKTFSQTITEIPSADQKSASARSLKVIITTESCTEEASGEKREKFVWLQLDGKVLKGCGYKPE